MKRLKWIGYALLAVVVLAAVLEIGFRVAAPALPEKLAIVARWVMTGQPYAQAWTPAWQENIDHYYALKPGVTNELQYGSPTVSFHLTTIELWDGAGIGFRTPPVDYFVDAVVVGDSFGMCFTEQVDCWVDILARNTGLGVVNLSQPVTGTTSHERILETFGAPMTPPLVIWQFFGNDFNDDYGLAVFRKDIQPVDTPVPPTPDTSVVGWLRTHSVAFAVIETAIAGRWYGLPPGQEPFEKPYSVTYGDHTLEFGGSYERQALDMSREKNQIGLGLSRTAFETAKALVDSWGGTMVVVVIPTREEVYSNLTAPALGQDWLDALGSARQAMFGICTDLDILCYDPLADFQVHAQNDEALYYTDDMHLNPHGNAVLAETLATWLDGQGLMPAH